MSAPLHTCWVSANNWQPGFVIIGANVKAIPTPPQSPVIIGSDGSWGAHEWTVYPQPHHCEFPYLTWIPLRQSNTSVPSSIHAPIDKSMWQAHPDQPNIHVSSPTLFSKITKEWESIKAVLQDLSKTLSFNPSFSSIWYPKDAYIRVLTTLNQLEKDFRAWQDFVKVFQNFQQSFLELLAFSDWWGDIRTGNMFWSCIHTPTRGAIFEDAWLYESYVCWSVGAFLLVHKSVFVLDPSNEVALSPRTLCKSQPMSLLPTLHTLDHWYYPLLVQDFVTELETTARGYVRWLDPFSPAKSFKHKLEKMENRKNDKGKLVLYLP